MPGFICHPGRFCMPVFTDAGALPDAALVLPDAFFELPDAAMPMPDAAMPAVDAGTDAATPRDAGRVDAGPGTPDAGMDAGADNDAGPLGGSFVGGAVCSASSTPTGSRATWAFLLTALGLVLARRRSNRR
jgi:MYXO-CTERM domain-containing protein